MIDKDDPDRSSGRPTKLSLCLPDCLRTFCRSSHDPDRAFGFRKKSYSLGSMRSDPENETPDPDFPSGEWIGFYRESGSRHRQDMHITFTAGRMSGAGADDIGDFVIRGSYDASTKEVWWTKVYPGSHSVHYKGYREIKGIWGLWEIPPVATDGFHIWPRSHGDGVRESVAAEQEVPEAVSVGVR